MPRFRAVLFDFDGTLADSYAAITVSVNYVLEKNGLPALSEEVVRGKVGHGLIQLMADLIPGGDAEANARLYHEHHPGIMAAHTRLLPGVAEMLEALKADGVRMAVCSNKPILFTQGLCDALNVTRYFTAILGPESCGKPKPDPAMLLKALELLQVNATESLYVGDMVVDIQTARAARLPVWVIPTGSCGVDVLIEAKPDRLMKSMAELLEQ